MFSLFGARKGQGAIEYLLIIGAAILIAAIVVTILISTTKKTEGSVEQAYSDFNKVVTSANIAESIDVTGSAGTAEGAGSSVDTSTQKNVQVVSDNDTQEKFYTAFKDCKPTVPDPVLNMIVSDPDPTTPKLQIKAKIKGKKGNLCTVEFLTGDYVPLYECDLDSSLDNSKKWEEALEESKCFSDGLAKHMEQLKPSK